jgi:hypothetical protein
MNYCVAPGAGCDSPVLRILDSSLSILETYDLASLAPITTPDALNAGAFRGITRASADIYAFEFVGAGVFDDLTFSARPTSVPEPSTLMLLVVGIGLSALRSRRRLKV